MKDAYYFSHDSNARNDQRLLAVRMQYGMRGYGIYFGIIEMLRDAAGYKLWVDDCSTIAFDLREPLEDVEAIVKQFGLFAFDGDAFYSPSLLARMEELDKKRAQRSNAGRIGGLVSSSNRQAIVNDRSTSKVKESKVKESIKKHTSEFFEEIPKPKFDFEMIWSRYPCKDGKKAALRYFKSSVKTQKDFEDIQTALQNYLQCEKVNKGYTKNGSTWFNNWRDWITNPITKTETQIIEEIERKAGLRKK